MDIIEGMCVHCSVLKSQHMPMHDNLFLLYWHVLWYYVLCYVLIVSIE